MATCKECFYYEHCGGFLPSDLDKDVWHYCAEGRADEIPDVDKRCTSFKDSSYFVPRSELDRSQKELDAAITIARNYKKQLDTAMEVIEATNKIAAEINADLPLYKVRIGEEYAKEVFEEIDKELDKARRKYRDQLDDKGVVYTNYARGIIANLKKKYTGETNGEM